jgi:hypothetical protein
VVEKNKRLRKIWGQGIAYFSQLLFFSTTYFLFSIAQLFIPTFIPRGTKVGKYVNII